MQEFNFTIHHVSGKSNTKADLLSRRPGFDLGREDNEDVTMLPPRLFRAIFTRNVTTVAPSSPFHQRIHRARRNVDKQVTRALECKVPGWVTLSDGTHLFKDQVYVPINRPLRDDIIRAHHDPALD